jgi:hypothetical protein
VVADCARDNFWPSLGLRSVLAPSAGSHKYQHPHTWIEVFVRAGFWRFDVGWFQLQMFVRLTADWLVRCLTCSHFALCLQVVDFPPTCEGAGQGDT